MKPTVGRIVHYVAPGSADGTYPPAHRAAIVTEVHSAPHIEHATIAIAILNPTGMHFVTKCEYVAPELNSPYSWHWPEREQE